MTMNQWTDSAKAIAGVFFGNPEMRAKQEQLDLEKQKVDIQNKQYMLEQALNPAKISQAEAAAAYNNAQAKTEATTLLLKQMELEGWNNLKNRRDGFGNPPVPSAPVMPEFNPYNVGPQGQGNNPAMVMSYDQIKPLDLGSGSIEDVTVPKGPAPPTVPMNIESIGAQAPTNNFDDLIANLTAPPPAQAPTSMLTPDVVDLLMSKSLSGQNIGDFLLAQEAFNANRGVTDPNKRILNAAAGRGTFASPDQVTAQAMGSTLPTARLSELGVQSMGTANMKDYEKTLEDPNYGNFLANQNAGTETTISYDADGKPIVTMGKGGKPPTEAQGKYSIAANQLARPIKYLESIGDFVPHDKDYYIAKTILDKPLTAPTAVRNMSPEAQRYFQAMKPIVAQSIFLQSGQAATEAEVMRKTLELTAVPGEDVEVTRMKRLAKQDLFDTVKGLGAPALPGTPLGAAGAVISPSEVTDPTGIVDQPAAPEITATGPKGEKIILRNGQWEPM